MPSSRRATVSTFSCRMSAPNFWACSAIRRASSWPLTDGEAGVVLDEVGVEEFAAWHTALEDDGVEHAAAGVHAGAEAGGAGTDDDQVVGGAGHVATGSG